MRVLVTGAHGYVGSIVLDQLTDIGIETISVDAGWFRDAYVLAPPQAVAGNADFRMLQVADLIGVEVVIHLAGYSNDPMGWLNHKDTHNLNEIATIAFAQKAKQAGVRSFVFSSTCSVYGDSGAEELNESGPTNPLTPYAAAKLAAEQALMAMHDNCFRVAILRGATAFGPSPVPRTDLLLNELCAQAACAKPLQLLSDGTSWRPFMPVDDFASALVAAALDQPKSDRDIPIWNIAPPLMQMTVKEAAERATAIGQAPSPRLRRNCQPDRRSYRVNGTRFLKAFPGYAYSTDFELQVARTISAFRAIPSLEADLRSDRFVRLAAFKKTAMQSTA